MLTGVGRSALGRRLLVDPLSLTVDACLEAVADAGLELDDIDGLSTYPGAAGMGMSEGGITAVEEALRLHPTWINGGGDLPGPGGAVIAAMLAVASGLCRHVLCFRTVWESSFAALGLGGAGGAARSSGPSAWRAPFGAMSAANWIAMNAHQYLHRYGAPREMLGLIALNGRANAARNPAAIYRDPMTMDDYLSARPITSPFGLYDCDVPCDGSIAVVVSDASTAADRPRPAVRIEAVGTQITERVSWDQGTITHEPQVLGQAAHLWSRTSLAPDRRRPGPALRRLHLQRHLVARGPRLLRLRGGPRLAGRGTADRPRRRAAGQSPRRPALGGADPRLRLPLRGRAAAPPRRRRRQVAGADDRRGHLGGRSTVGRAPPPAGRVPDGSGGRRGQVDGRGQGRCVSVFQEVVTSA